MGGTDGLDPADGLSCTSESVRLQAIGRYVGR